MAKGLGHAGLNTCLLIQTLTGLGSGLAWQPPAFAESVPTLATSTTATTGTTATNSSTTPTAPDAAKHPQVQADWQERMLKLLANNKDGLTQAWGLFSEGGWSNVGQVIVLASPDGRKRRLITGAPNAEDLVGGSERELKAGEWQKIERQIQAAQKLPNINETMFDGLIFEFVSAKRERSSQTKITHRLYIKQTGNTPHPAHDALINAFQALRQPTR